MRIDGQRILLTGAAGGIGSQLAVALAKRGETGIAGAKCKQSDCFAA